MIDYQKIETARHLCAKLDHYYFTLGFCSNRANQYLIDIGLHCTDGTTEEFDSFVRLIEKLTELTKPEPKYRVNQLLWFQGDDIVRSFVVEKIYFDEGGCIYHGGEWDICEKDLFLTRQALIEHQLQYWRTQLEDELEQHVSPYCEPQHSHLWVGGKCHDCGVEKPDIQRNQPQVDVDRCQHEWLDGQHGLSQKIFDDIAELINQNVSMNMSQ